MKHVKKMMDCDNADVLEIIFMKHCDPRTIRQAAIYDVIDGSTSDAEKKSAFVTYKDQLAGCESVKFP